MKKSNIKNTILIVDDIPENLDILVEVLNPLYEIEATIYGEKAIEIANSDSPPDLILLDVVMPEIGGFEVCKKIRETKNSSELPIIFLTAESDKESVVTGFEVGGQDYVFKPFHPKELLSRVNTHLDLKNKTAQLDNLNQFLEQKVVERTKQLNDSKVELIQANLKLENSYSALKNLDMAKTKFLRIISHEIRTPLNGIVGTTELLKDTLDSDESLEILKYLKLSVERLNGFSNKALQIIQLQTGKKDIEKEKNDILKLSEQIFDEFKDEIDQKNIIVKNDIPKNLDIISNYHFSKICLKNIINNAIRYNLEGGTVFLNISYEGNYICINIKNNGKGFSPETLGNIFSFFYTGHDPVDTDYGLGLATSKLIMDAHMGEIKVGNVPEVGAIVTLLFPRNPQ